MKTWHDYKNFVKENDSKAYKDIEETEELVAIIQAMVEQRHTLGLSQRELAALCNIPQSSVARIESYSITPNLKTILNIFQHLGLSLKVTQSNQTTME